ncbi:MAG: histidine phosphatase family protein [Bacteroidetes bacterium]|nr:histidine phosphatase family protein [Bacteroidota bacterium]
MIVRELYIVRHGQTDHNAKGIIQGKGVDLPLNETGQKQANAFFQAYRSVPFDALYSSTLLRAQQTIAPFKQSDIPHFIKSDLDEISWGDLEGKITTLESDERFKQLIARWRAGDLNAKPSSTGESPYELQQRQQRFLEYLLTTSHKKILIATHGRFIRAFMCTLTGRPLSEMEQFNHANLCLYKVNQLQNGRFEIVTHFETGHLASL